MKLLERLKIIPKPPSHLPTNYPIIPYLHDVMWPMRVSGYHPLPQRNCICDKLERKCSDHSNGFVACQPLEGTEDYDIYLWIKKKNHLDRVSAHKASMEKRKLKRILLALSNSDGSKTTLDLEKSPLLQVLPSWLKRAIIKIILSPGEGLMNDWQNKFITLIFIIAALYMPSKWLLSIKDAYLSPQNLALHERELHNDESNNSQRSTNSISQEIDNKRRLSNTSSSSFLQKVKRSARKFGFSKPPENYVTKGDICYDPEIELGHGSLGTKVFKGDFQGRKCAIKRLLFDNKELATKEIEILMKNDLHHNVIRYYAYEYDENFLYIALELCECTLQEYIKKDLSTKWRNHQAGNNPTSPPPKGRLEIGDALFETITGLEHLHKAGVVHRDIKPSNILIAKNPNGERRIVVSDFGLAKQMDSDKYSFSLKSKSGLAGTNGWIAPELLDFYDADFYDTPMNTPVANAEELQLVLPGRKTVTNAVDIFSLGCVFFFCITKDHPFGNALERQIRISKDDSDVDKLITDKDGIYRRNAIKHKNKKDGVIITKSFGASKQHTAHHLIKNMINVKPELRPPAEACKVHPFFWQKDKMLQFIVDVSSKLETFKINYEEKTCAKIIYDIEVRSDKIFDDRGWGNLLKPEIKADLTAKRPYNYQSVISLIRAIRNKYSHFNDLSDELKELYCGYSCKKSRNPNEKDTSYIKFWLVKLPALIIQTWISFQNYQDGLSYYYPDKVSCYGFEWSEDGSFEGEAGEMVPLPPRLMKESLKYDRKREEKANGTSSTTSDRKPAHIRLRENKDNKRDTSQNRLSYSQPSTPSLSRDHSNSNINNRRRSNSRNTSADTLDDNSSLDFGLSRSQNINQNQNNSNPESRKSSLDYATTNAWNKPLEKLKNNEVNIIVPNNSPKSSKVQHNTPQINLPSPNQNNTNAVLTPETKKKKNRRGKRPNQKRKEEREMAELLANIEPENIDPAIKAAVKQVDSKID